MFICFVVLVVVKPLMRWLLRRTEVTKSIQTIEIFLDFPLSNH